LNQLLMSIDDDITFLERVPTLSLLGREALRILAIGAESRYIHDGDVLFREGEVADAGYVVQEGGFTLTSGNARTGAAPMTVGPGALIGELALLTETVRPTTATATEPSSVIRIPRKLFLKMLEGYPDAAARLREVVALRTTQAMADIAGIRPVFDAGLKPE
jgi:CRP-like cAMP-binding protein